VTPEARARHRASRRRPAINRPGAALGGARAPRRLRHRLRLPLRPL